MAPSLTAVIGVSVTTTERLRIANAARHVGLSRSAWMRSILVAALQSPPVAATPNGSLTHGITVHVTTRDYEAIVRRAEADELSTASWARAQLLAYLDHQHAAPAGGGGSSLGTSFTPTA